MKLKRGTKKPASDFYFDFALKVIASHPSSTGFLVKVFTEQQSGEEHEPRSAL